MPHQAANLVAAQLAQQQRQRAAGLAGGVLPAGVAEPGVIGALAAARAVPLAALDPSAAVAVVPPQAPTPPQGDA